MDLNRISLAIVLMTGVMTTPVMAMNDSSKTVCTIEGNPEPRIVELIYDTTDSPIPCRVLYTKDGSTVESGSAKNTKGHCEKIERNIVRKLIKADYQCDHSFQGALAPQDRSVVLNLFEAPVLTTPKALDVSAEDSAAELAARQRLAETTEALEASLAESVNTDTQTQLLEALTVALSEVYGDIDPDAISLTIDVSVDVDVTIDETLTTLAEAGTTNDTSGDVPALAATDLPSTDEKSYEPANPGAVLTASNNDYAILSIPLSSESEAHRYASEVRSLYPNVVSRVSRASPYDSSAESANDSQWHVVLGESRSEEQLISSLALLTPAITEQFAVTALNDSAATSLDYVPDDWARYAVASCYAKGHQTTTDIADCAGVVVDVDSFLSCVGGGVCAPQLFSDNVKPEHIDLLAVIGSDDPVAVARQRLVERVEGCERLDGDSDSDFAECAALSILDDDQREVYDCYQRDSSTLGMLQCAGSDSVSDYAYLYERCTADSYMAAECVLDNLDNDYLADASRCVHYGDTEAVLSCALDSSLDIDESRALSCLQYSDNNTARAQCLARDYLSDTDSALLRCATETTDITAFGLCSAERNGDLTREEYLAAQCLLAGNTDSQSLLSCAGGRFASNDIGNCLINGIDDPACFDTETELNQLADNAMEDFIATNGLESDLALFRQGLYADEGGDIPDILASAVLLKVFAGTKKAAKAVTGTVKKGTKNVFKRFGFGKN